MRITVAVKPNSKKELVQEQEDGSFIVRVNALPVDGKANARVIELLAKYFDVSKSSIQLVSGPQSKKKIFSVDKS